MQTSDGKSNRITTREFVPYKARIDFFDFYLLPNYFYSIQCTAWKYGDIFKKREDFCE